MGFLKRKKPVRDMLETKKGELIKCIDKSTVSVGIIGNIMSELKTSNGIMQEKVKEIDAYKVELDKIRGKLNATIENNDKVIAKFSEITTK